MQIRILLSGGHKEGKKALRCGTHPTPPPKKNQPTITLTYSTEVREQRKENIKNLNLESILRYSTYFLL
jgi:hypothetical protein